jgi:hypothetical protein
MKRLVSIHLFETKAKACERCGMDYHEGNGCCRDEVKLVKLVQDQNKIVVSNPGIAKLAPMECTPSAYLVSSTENAAVNPHYNNHSPPLLSEQDLYLQHNVFRI